MKEELMTEVMQQMLPYLDNAQLKQLRQVMEQTLYHYEVTGAEAKPEEERPEERKPEPEKAKEGKEGKEPTRSGRKKRGKGENRSQRIEKEG